MILRRKNKQFKNKMTIFVVYNRMKRFCAYIVVSLAAALLFGGAVKAQDYKWLSNNNMVVEVRGHYGFFYHHHFEMEKFNAHFPAFEASLYQSTFGKREWQTLYNYPYIGCTFYHSGLGDFEDLGEAYALYPFINYPLLRGETSQLTFKFGAGVAYLTNCFDHLENPYNFSIGSHLNAAVNLSFEYRERLTPHLMSVASIGLTHFSNGATKSPNYGLNTISGALGLACYLRAPRADAIFAKRPEYYKYEFDGKNWFCVDLNYGLGVKDVSQTMGKNEQYLVHSFTARFLAQFTTCSRAGINFSINKDNSDKALPNHFVKDGVTYLINEYQLNDSLPIQTELIRLREYQLIKPDLGICYSMTMDRLSYLFEIGVHLNFRSRDKNGIWNTSDVSASSGQPAMMTTPTGTTLYPVKTLPPFSLATDFSSGSIYERVILQYFLLDNLYAHISLTTHLARADYVCLGIGYRFNQKYYLNKHAKTSKRPPGVR